MIFSGKQYEIGIKEIILLLLIYKFSLFIVKKLKTTLIIDNVNISKIHYMIGETKCVAITVILGVVLLQRKCRSEDTCSYPNPTPYFFVMGTRADPSQNYAHDSRAL